MILQHGGSLPDIFFNWADDAEGVSLVEGRDVVHRFPRHAHDSLVAGYVSAGRLAVTRGDSVTIVGSGYSYIVNPNEPHETASDTPSSYITVCVKRTRLESFCAEAKIGARVRFTHDAIEDPDLAALITGFASLLRDRHARLERESAIEALLAHLTSRYGGEAIASEISPAALTGAERARAYIDAHADEDVSLAELSAAAGVSPFFLTRSFSKAYGVPPHLYLMQTRIKKAQRELIGGKRIVDVSLECGFFDQSHFSRVFLRETGMTPGEFLECNAESDTK